MILYSSVSKPEDCYLITVRNISVAQWINDLLSSIMGYQVPVAQV